MLNDLRLPVLSVHFTNKVVNPVSFKKEHGTFEGFEMGNSPFDDTLMSHSEDCSHENALETNTAIEKFGSDIDDDTGKSFLKLLYQLL